MLESISQLKKRLKKELKVYLDDPKIFDILIIGSVVKGKENPKDVDLIVLTYEKQDKIIYELRKKNYHAENLLIKNLFKEQELLKTILKEGFSLKSNKKILPEKESLLIFSYSLDNLKPLDNKSIISVVASPSWEFTKTGLLSTL